MGVCRGGVHVGVVGVYARGGVCMILQYTQGKLPGNVLHHLLPSSP